MLLESYLGVFSKHLKYMKNIKTRKNTEKKNLQCVLCHANFEVWVDNLKIVAEREEKLRGHFLSYCPACAREDNKH